MPAKKKKAKPRARKPKMATQKVDIREHRNRLREIDRPGGSALGWFIAAAGMALLWTMLHQVQ